MARVDADFPGAACPPGSLVGFSVDGRRREGQVAELHRRHALIAVADGLRVPYERLRVIERAGRDHTLGEVEAIGDELLGLHKRFSGLRADWTFGFDLSPVRAGVCRYGERRIDLSVSYCLQAALDDVADTILHEIAHAIVGKAHNHDAVWCAKAREIGCTGERTHSVEHTEARWLGECACGVRWRRQRLHRRLRRGAVCPACGSEIAWRSNVETGQSDRTVVRSEVVR